MLARHRWQFWWQPRLRRASNAQEHVPSPREVVTPAVYVSAEPAARGVPFQIAVVLNIRPGFHVNAREKSAEYLIATDLKAEVPAGFKTGEVVYPKGELHTFTFSKTPLNVVPGKGHLAFAADRAGRRASGFAANSAEAALSGLQHGNLPAAGYD